MNNTTRTCIYLFFAGFVLLGPSFAYADSRPLCKEIQEREARAESLFSEHKNRLENKDDEKGEEFSLFEEKRILQKKNTEETLARHIDSITSLATTPAQKKAVTAYSLELKNIAKIRAEEIEQVQKEYRDEIKNILDQKKLLEKNILEEYKESSKKAFEDTFRNCEKGRFSFLFKRELKNDIGNNHRKFVQQLSSVNFEQNMSSLKISRDQKIQTIQNTFLQKHIALTNTLRTLFSR